MVSYGGANQKETPAERGCSGCLQTRNTGSIGATCAAHPVAIRHLTLLAYTMWLVKELSAQRREGAKPFCSVLIKREMITLPIARQDDRSDAFAGNKSVSQTAWDIHRIAT